MLLKKKDIEQMESLFIKILNRIKLHSLQVVNVILLLLRKYPDVIDSAKSVNEIIEKNLSVCRFGDGELMIINGDGWGFQEQNRKLGERLKEVLGSNDDRIAVCLPDVFKDRSRFTRKVRHFWYQNILNNLIYWNKYTLKDKIYLDSLFTRYYMDHIDKKEFPNNMVSLIKQIWQDEDILIIEGEGSRLGYKNNLFDNVKSIQRILCPPENAFDAYERIFDSARKHSKNKMVLLALGMTATILAYDLAKLGFRALDIGHVDIEYEWYKMKAKKKVPVKYRYMNEVSVREYVELTDPKFTSQILERIV